MPGRHIRDCRTRFAASTCHDGVVPRPGTALLATSTSPIVDLLLSRPARLGRSRLLAVDGPAGSGKTRLAGDVERVLHERGADTATVHLDDLYEGWTGLDTALEMRVITQLLEPLGVGRAARWQRYDWPAGRFDGWVHLPVPDVLVLDGCGSGAQAYDAWTSLLVWLEADPETRLRRGVDRDGEQVRDHWLAWMPLEEEHFAANNTRSRADVHFST